MKSSLLIALCAVVASPVLAEDSRQLDSHEHGVGELNIAIDGTQIAMELHAPGADIVGFEYEATSEQDLAKIDAALAVLSQPDALFKLPEAAGCTVVEAAASLEGEDAHDDHGHDNHDDHDTHDDHETGTNHTEFHAEYLLTCTDMSALSDMSFAYFDAFPNALEVEVQIISDVGATAMEVERDAPILDLSALN